MKILIAGSSGLIGSQLKTYLLNAGHQVLSLERQKQGSIYWDPDQGEISAQALEGFDAVINLCGENIAERWTEEKKRQILESRVKTTRLLADTLAYLAHPPKIWINASAVGFYGHHGETTLTENTPAGSGFLAQVCQAWEGATQTAEKKGVRVVHARFGIVLSLKGGLLGRLLTPFRLGLGGKIGDGKQYMSWVAIEDVLGAIVHILQHEEFSGAVNIVSPHPVTNQQFTEALGNVLHRPTFCTLPAPLAKLLFGREMAEEMLLASTRVYPKKLIETEYVFQYPKLEDALQYYLGKSD